MNTHERAERFARQVSDLRIDDPTPGRPRLWLGAGAALMVVGLGCSLFAVVRATGTTNALVQRDAVTVALAGIAATIVGTGLYLRYSVTKVLRFWMARLSFELQARSDDHEMSS